MNLEEYLTPVEEVEHMKAALAFYDDQNLWCCFTADDNCGPMRQKRAVATAMAKELISFTRDSEPSSTGTWRTEWPYAVCTGQDGGSHASVVWEYCQVVGVAALPPPSSSSSSSSTTEYVPSATTSGARRCPTHCHQAARAAEVATRRFGVCTAVVRLWREDHRRRHGAADPP